MYKKLLLIYLIVISISNIDAQILPERERADVVNEILEERFKTLLPQLMRTHDIEMWVLIAREYNEDPVLRTMLPATWLNARRRTILVFYNDPQENTLERLAVARYGVGESIQSAWDKEQEPNQWEALMQLIKERSPKNIALNYSQDFAQADGIVKTDYDAFMQYLPEKFSNRIISAEPLAVGWLEHRTPREMEIYEQLVAITHTLIKETFSAKTITVGETTSDDLVWHLRQRVTDMGLDTWFHPTVDIQRSNEELKSHIDAFSNGYADKVIQAGDLLHCDFGITYLRLNTDCQQHAYVLKKGEVQAPQYLSNAFAKANKLQDILTSNFKTGRTGNAILKASLSEARKQGLRPSIYTHPLGLYGHASGPTIGMWDNQEHVPGSGEYTLHENTAYAIELNTTVNIEEWDKDIRIMLEEDGYWGSNGFRYINKRQEELLLVKSN